MLVFFWVQKSFGFKINLSSTQLLPVLFLFFRRLFSRRFLLNQLFEPKKNGAKAHLHWPKLTLASARLAPARWYHLSRAPGFFSKKNTPEIHVDNVNSLIVYRCFWYSLMLKILILSTKNSRFQDRCPPIVEIHPPVTHTSVVTESSGSKAVKALKGSGCLMDIMGNPLKGKSRCLHLSSAFRRILLENNCFHVHNSS